MGCGLSKQNEADDAVSLCRERKRLLKLAVEKRYAFADAHRCYNQSLYEMATALRLFVARQSSSSSPFLLTFPSSSVTDHPHETHVSKPTFLPQRPMEPTEFEETSDSSKLETQEEDEEDEEVLEADAHEENSESQNGEELCNHFYGDEVQAQAQAMPMPIPSSQRGFGWDFFNPFDEMTAEEVNCFRQNYNEDSMAFRGKEGVPELEKNEERGKNGSEVVREQNGDGGQNQNRVADTKINGDFMRLGESKGLRVTDMRENGRELLEALKDIEDYFIRAYDSGFEISKMLEANRVQVHSGFEEIKENSNKLIQSITWNRSTSFRSSSRRSLLTSTSTNSSTWTDFKNVPFNYYGMEAGNHALTLERLFAWEKKLYEEVKTGEEAKKNYVRMCSKDKHSAELNDLHARITVGIRTVESISNRIQKLRDEELQPQLIELLQGLMGSWKLMSELHQTQNRVILEVTSFNPPSYGKFCNDSHRLATLQLEASIENWHACFTAYISAQKAYVEALFCWLCKFVDPEVELFYKGECLMPSFQASGAPLLVICHKWFVCLQNLPDKAVTYAMENFGKNIHVLGGQQGEEQQQKRKVDRLAKEIDKRTLLFEREERRTLESELSVQGSSVHNSIVYLAEQKNQLDMFRKKLDAEKVKHLISMQETQHVTRHGIQTGLSSVFETLTEFSKASTLMYTNLITQSANAKTLDENDVNASHIGDTL